MNKINNNNSVQDAFFVQYEMVKCKKKKKLTFYTYETKEPRFKICDTLLRKFK